MTERHPSIAAEEKKMADARTAAIESVRSIQAECPHSHVVETPWKTSNYFAPSAARRICVACGLEEAVQWGNWPGMTCEGGFYEFIRPPRQKTVLNSEFVKRGDVCNFRVRL